MAKTKALSKPKSKQVKSRVKNVQKLETPNLANQIDQNVEPVKPQGINWDVIGFSSAALTLSGAALLFMLGWAYEVNWYGYFGVSMSQVDSLPQNVIIQSIPGVVTILTIFALSTLLVLIFFPALQFIEDTIKFLRNKSKPESSKSKKTLMSSKSLSMAEWITVLLLTEYFLISVFISSNKDVAERIKGLNTAYEIFYLKFFMTGLSPAVPYVIGASLIIVVILVIMRSLKFSLNYQLTLKTPQNSIILIALIISIIFTTIAMSATYAINDAARGIRGSGGWSVQPILLISSNKMRFPKSLKVTCDLSNCVSGPFGLIGENDKSFILIKWKGDDEIYFKYQPGLYIIPKSDNTYLVPLTDSSTAQPTPTPNPTFTSEITPAPSQP